MGRKGSSTVDTFDLPRTAGPLMSRPAPNAPVDVKIDFLQQQLDQLGVEQPILGHLVLLGRGSNLRLQGGMIHNVCSSVQGFPVLAVRVGFIVCDSF